jgi:hypothetical protein
MSEKRPVVVYGVSGYTGRLVCEYLREYNVPFIAAGRDAAKVRAVVEKIPGIETADYEVVHVEHSVEALTKLFKGARFVSNMVGPFIKYGSEVVEACLNAGCHYSDTTGEQDWVLKCQETWGEKFAAKGLLLAPNMAQMYTTGEIAANICLRVSDLRLDPDDLHHSEGEVVLPRAKQVRRMGCHGARGRRGAGPARDLHRGAVGRYGPSGMVPQRSPRL